MRSTIILIFVALIADTVSAKEVDWKTALGLEVPSRKINWNPLPDKTYSRLDKSMLASYVVINYIDLSQTVYALEGCHGKCVGKYKEANPFWGDHPSRSSLIAGKVAIGYLFAVVLKNAEPRARRRGLIVANIIHSSVVLSNANKPMVGFRVGF